MYDVATLLPSAMGGLVRTEVEVLKRLTVDPARPYAVVLGGAKVADKLAVIDNLLGKADRLLIGGGMLFTFLAAQGHGIGKSLFDEASLDACKGYLARAQESGVELVLPVDVVCGREFAADTEIVTVDADAIPDDMMGLDIGPKSAALYAGRLTDCRTVFWNGPMGAFEMAPSRRAPRPSRRRWSRPPRPVRSPWSAAVTPRRPSGCSGSPTTSSATSRPAVARAWSTSRARTCPA